MMMFRPAGGGDIFDAIHADVFTAMEALGDTEAQEWRDRVSVPVEYVTGPRGGVGVVRSKPGESPRAETRELYDGIQSAVESDGDLVTVAVDNDVAHALYTNEGTSRMAPRPHAPDIDDFTERLLDAIVGAI